jgi:hypothetical protein
VSEKNWSTVDRNAEACERAAHPVCRCACRGALHGSAHTHAWRARRVAELDEHDYRVEQEMRAAIAATEHLGEPDLFEDLAFLRIPRSSPTPSAERTSPAV